ncbi:MAG: DUF1599 domain-containing protein [Candidatus Pacebacteria bacterium]|nr:DUF1599 domain-containing protein [Candidatus Paceibacterota bacterium]MBP9851647.1 DUF1599 domain-containing protein [Candidatus Paceibacterota bacterium]
MKNSTLEKIVLEYIEFMQRCRDLFVKKMRDYDTAWAILRLTSVTDQIKIKVERIESIFEKGTQKISDTIESEFVGIINYSIIGCIQADRQRRGEIDATTYKLPHEEVMIQYDNYLGLAKAQLVATHLKFGDLWREMPKRSLNKIIQMKIEEIQQIEDNNPKSSDVFIENYYLYLLLFAVFGLIVGKAPKAFA